MKPAERPEPGASDAEYCSALVRSDDRDRYLAAQFAPSAARARLLALLAVNAEISRIPRAAREPLLAEMRLKWWHDAVMAALAQAPTQIARQDSLPRPNRGAIEEARQDSLPRPDRGAIEEARQDSLPRPNRGAIEEARQESLPRQPALAAFARAVGEAGMAAGRMAGPFERLIVARTRDIAAKPALDAGEAVERAEALSGAVVEAALVLIGVEDEAAHRAARAAGIAHVLAVSPGADSEPIRGLIRDHVARARAESPRAPRAALPVLLWATAAEIRSRRLARGRPPSAPGLPLLLAWRAWRDRY